MTSPPGAEDALLGELSNHERAVLAAWAHDGDAPDGFEDRVVAAVLAERLGDLGDGGGDETEVARRRAAPSEGKVVRLVGWAAAIAAAAAVLLMVSVRPRASEVEQAREVVAADRAVQPKPGPEPEPGPELEPGVPEPEPACETIDALAAEATLVATRYCTPCHDSADRDAHPGAAGVFDVQQQEWWSFMSEAQIEGARRRAQVIEHATEDERHKLDAFLAKQLEEPFSAG